MNLPDLPSLPTDNLYKFMALSGVILLIAAPFFWANYYIAQVERTRLAWELLGQSIPPYDYYKLKAKLEHGDHVTEQEARLVEHYDLTKKASSRVGSEFLVYEDFRRVITGLAISLGVLGCGLTFFGFRLWYLRVQKPLDCILRKQTTKSTTSN